MPAVATRVERAIVPGHRSWSKRGRRVLQALLGVLDRLVPPHAGREEAELPPEWFKYPPI